MRGILKDVSANENNPKWNNISFKEVKINIDDKFTNVEKSKRQNGIKNKRIILQDFRKKYIK